MANRKKTSQIHTNPPPATPEAKEQQLISLAIAQAEEQLRNKTAPTQVVVHYLKLASSKERLEKEMLAKKTELVAAQTESIKAQKRMDELYENALKAMKLYSGNVEDEPK